MKYPSKVADALNNSWVYRLLPENLWPYAQLARWERPIGWQLLMWPCLWSLALAANYYSHEFYNHVHIVGHGDARIYNIVPAYLQHKFLLPFTGQLGADMFSVFVYLLLFIIGAITMRGAGCTYNDLVDENIDMKVARTRSRPLPSGRVSRKNAWLFLGLQLFAGLLILLQFNTYTIVVGFVSVVTIIIYPFMKRITWWPQLFLGFAFSWGALMGWSAIAGKLYPPALLLYVGSICWVIGYDTIYAHQDIEDDMIANVKSTARLFAQNTRIALNILYCTALIFFAMAFYLTDVNWPAWTGLGIGALHLGWQIKKLDIDNPDQCLALFKSNNVFGWIIFSGLVVSVFSNAVQ